MTNIKEKCVVALFGKKIHLSLCCSVTEDLDEKEVKVENRVRYIQCSLICFIDREFNSTNNNPLTNKRVTFMNILKPI